MFWPCEAAAVAAKSFKNKAMIQPMCNTGSNLLRNAQVTYVRKDEVLRSLLTRHKFSVLLSDFQSGFRQKLHKFSFYFNN